MYLFLSFLPSLNPKVSHSTKIKSLEGLINLVPGPQEFPTSLLSFTPNRVVFFFLLLLFLKHSWACKLVSAPGPLFLFPSTWNSLPLSFTGLISLCYSVLRSQVTSKKKPFLTTQSQAVSVLFYLSSNIMWFLIYGFNHSLSTSTHRNKSRTLICLFTIVYLGPGA